MRGKAPTEPRYKTFSTRSRSQLIDDEVLRTRVRTLIEEKPPTSGLRRFLLHPLTTVAITFLLTGLAGAAVANHYYEKQKKFEFNLDEQKRQVDFERQQHQAQLQAIQRQSEAGLDFQRRLNLQQLQNADEAHQQALDHQRTINREALAREGNFSVELAREKLKALSEVWASIYAYETEFARAQQRYEKVIREKKKSIADGTDPELATAAIFRDPVIGKIMRRSLAWAIAFAAAARQAPEIFKASSDKYDSLSAAVNKNRFWLDEDNYRVITDYISATRSYIILTSKEVNPNNAKASQSHQEKIKASAAKLKSLRQSLSVIKDRLLNN